MPLSANCNTHWLHLDPTILDLRAPRAGSRVDDLVRKHGFPMPSDPGDSRYLMLTYELALITEAGVII